jgi:hypothetical protein
MTRLAPLLVALAATACAETPTLRLEIDAEAEVPGAVDQLRVEVAALGPDGNYCHSDGPFLFVLEGPDDLPVRVDLEQGETFATLLAYRVTGWLATSTGDEEEVFSREGNARWPESEKRVVQVTFPESCYRAPADPPRCAAPLQCNDEGGCETVPIPGVFDLAPGGDDGCALTGADDD